MDFVCPETIRMCDAEAWHRVRRQGVLDSMDKGIDLDIVSLALKALKKAGIATYVYLLFGHL